MKLIPWLCCGAVSAGCAVGPSTGETYDGTTAGASLEFTGWTDMPDAGVKVYALSDPYAHPDDGPFTVIGTGKTSVNATPGMNDPSRPAYGWNLDTSPISGALWRQGGLLRMKVASTVNGGTVPGALTTFDDSGWACASAQVQAGEKWWKAGQNCQTPYPDGEIITMTSTTPMPSEGNTVRYLARRGGVQVDKCTPLKSPNSTVAQTTAYYNAIGAPLTLALFKSKYGFGAAGSNEVQAVYYNAGDLGIGRQMNCKTKAVIGGVQTACYVSNFARDPVVPFPPKGFGPENLDPQIAIDQAIGAIANPSLANEPVATVAMVHDSTAPADRRVQFMVYDDDGDRIALAPLDNHGVQANGDPAAVSTANLAVPQNCLTCHGPTSTYPGTGRVPLVYNARFLPFDPDAFLFSTSNPAFSREATLPKLKLLNEFVWDTQPNASIMEMLAGMYPSNDGTGPKNDFSTFDPNYLPAGWNLSTAQARAAKTVYTKVVKPYCRTCHVAHDGFDLNTYQELADLAPVAGYLVCNQNSTVPMPQAEQVQNRMWKSGARAHLMAAFSMSGACTPIEEHPDEEPCP